MFSKVFTGGLNGIEPYLIEVEAAVSPGLRQFSLIGLADTTIKEAKERVASALKAAGFKSPLAQNKRVLINLAPAYLKKEGSLYDLPIALAYLLADKQTNFMADEAFFLGELALNGKIKPVNGAFSFTLLAMENRFKYIILPKKNVKEAFLALRANKNKSIKIIPVETVQEAANVLSGPNEIKNLPYQEEKTTTQTEILTIGMIKGQSFAKMALEIAAAGGHNVMLEGPPGAGKTLLAKSIVSILPEPEPEELLEIAKIYSSRGLLNDSQILYRQRPFRNPHHTASEAALLGGGNPPRPGEISLSHRGVLFLDEFPEFHRDVLESLRQPLEDGFINIQRARYGFSLPAKFILIASANPCPCGYFNSPNHICKCTSGQISAYRRKLSGPLIDRLDIYCQVPAIKYEDLISKQTDSETKEIKNRVSQARQIQKQRFKNQGILTNNEMNIKQIQEYCPIFEESHRLLQKYVNSGKLTARGFHKVLKTARTIADLKQNKNIAFNDIKQALSFRLKQSEL